MKELTVDRCRKQILRLKKCISEGYVSINERDYLQALEIALPILEQQERGEADQVEDSDRGDDEAFWDADYD